MGFAAVFLGLFASAMGLADKLERERGPRSRLWLLVMLPIQLIGLLFLGRLVAMAIEPGRRMLGRSPNPWQARVMDTWLATLASTPGVGRVAPALVVLGGEGSWISNAAARGIGLGLDDSVWVFGRISGLPEAQLQAVLAHELGHLRLRHFLALAFGIALLAAVLPPLGRKLAGPKLAPLGSLGALLLGAGLVAGLSRQIEDGADDFALATGHGPGLAAFFETAQLWQEEAAARPEPTHLLGRILYRLARLRPAPDSRFGRFDALATRVFASHRPLAERKARLEQA